VAGLLADHVKHAAVMRLMVAVVFGVFMALFGMMFTMLVRFLSVLLGMFNGFLRMLFHVLVSLLSYLRLVMLVFGLMLGSFLAV
jgi:hypothetical protein